MNMMTELGAKLDRVLEELDMFAEKSAYLEGQMSILIYVARASWPIDGNYASTDHSYHNFGRDVRTTMCNKLGI